MNPFISLREGSLPDSNLDQTGSPRDRIGRGRGRQRLLDCSKLAARVACLLLTIEVHFKCSCGEKLVFNLSSQEK